MSCGNPHDKHCAEVIQQVWLYLDAEMPDDDCSEIRAHLEECSPCLREYGLEQDFKALVARKCGCEEAPGELRTRLVAKLREVRLEITQVEFRAD
jgi:mycothiol system anti-sigma-R factor